ncbi:hypothetical protein IMZ48_35305 [Candidatus Bathyarchaeota archaeon]|nr:hypothetical protein [Candidatus Bathyarchaeota archaeon]
MHAISTLAVLASLATGILAQGIGTFTASADFDCLEDTREITVTNPDGQGQFPRPVRSIRSNLKSCARKSRHFPP